MRETSCNAMPQLPQLSLSKLTGVINAFWGNWEKEVVVKIEEQCCCCCSSVL